MVPGVERMPITQTRLPAPERPDDEGLAQKLAKAGTSETRVSQLSFFPAMVAEAQAEHLANPV